MPIYEYYCPHCHGRYRHFARQLNAPPPSCPRCGAEDVEKLVSTVNTTRSESERRAAFDKRAQAARDADVQRAAQVLQEGDALTDEVAPFGMDRDAFRAIVERRAAGATDAELEDVIDAMSLPEPPEGAAHDHGEHDHHHHHEHHHGHRRDAEDLGWAK